MLCMLTSQCCGLANHTAPSLYSIQEKSAMFSAQSRKLTDPCQRGLISSYSATQISQWLLLFKWRGHVLKSKQLAALNDVTWFGKSLIYQLSFSGVLCTFSVCVRHTLEMSQVKPRVCRQASAHNGQPHLECLQCFCEICPIQRPRLGHASCGPCELIVCETLLNKKHSMKSCSNRTHKGEPGPPHCS